MSRACFCWLFVRPSARPHAHASAGFGSGVGISGARGGKALEASGERVVVSEWCACWEGRGRWAGVKSWRSRFTNRGRTLSLRCVSPCLLKAR